MLKLLLFPFIAIFVILRTIFFPWFLRWFFKLNFAIYFGLALGVGYLAYTAFNDYTFNLLEADLRVSEDPPARTALSKWSVNDVGDYGEVNVAGIYFPELPSGSFESAGTTRDFVMLADDLGREVKAVLLIGSDDVPRLQRQLADQGNGDRMSVTIGGTLSRNIDWDSAIRAEISRLNLPVADDIVVFKPFVGGRAAWLYDQAEDAFDVVIGFGAIAALLAVLGLGKFGLGLGQRGSAATQSQRSAREVHAEKQAKQPTQKALPMGDAPASPSPWGQSEAQLRAAASASQMVQPQAKQPQSTPSRRSSNPIVTDEPLLTPPFKSVFPGGGSSFRFKTADQIIRQSFGTLSSLKPLKRSE